SDQIYSTRKEAQEHGGNRYTGIACSTCSSTVRYVKGQGCVACVQKRSHANYRKPESKARRDTPEYKIKEKTKRKVLYQKPAFQKRMREHHLKQYGITQRDYERMLVAQNMHCGICIRPQKKRLFVDHNHTTGQVR